MDVESYYCSRLCIAANTNSTLALGFYCRNSGFIADVYLLDERFAAGERSRSHTSRSTPTVPTVEEQSVRPVPERDDEFSDLAV